MIESRKRKPDFDLLDRLRAGLLDGEPDQKSRAERMVMENSDLQDRTVGQVIEHLNETADNAMAINNQLRVRRREVLGGNAKRTPQQRIPQVALAAAASVVLAIAIGWFALPGPINDRTTNVSGDSEEISDLAENLDFYVWLQNQRQASGPSGNGT